MEIQYYFIWEKSLARGVKVDYISTLEQQADVSIKPLDTFKYYWMHESINILPIPILVYFLI